MLNNNINTVDIGHSWTKRQPKAICQYVFSMWYDLTPSCMWHTCDVTTKFCRDLMSVREIMLCIPFKTRNTTILFCVFNLQTHEV